MIFVSSSPLSMSPMTVSISTLPLLSCVYLPSLGPIILPLVSAVLTYFPSHYLCSKRSLHDPHPQGQTFIENVVKGKKR